MLPAAPHLGHLAPVMEIAFDQETLLHRDLLAQELTARNLALLLIKKNWQPLLRPLKKSLTYHPQGEKVINLCGHPQLGGFNHTQCALAVEQHPRLRLSGASSTCLRLMEEPPSAWAPASLTPRADDLHLKTLQNLLPQQPDPTRTSFYQKTFGGAILQISFLQGTPKTFCQNGIWRPTRYMVPEEHALIVKALQTLSQKGNCPLENLYGSVLVIRPAIAQNSYPSSCLKILQAELNPPLHSESPWIPSLKSSHLSYPTLLKLALNLSEEGSHKTHRLTNQKKRPS